jgi:hypothetical protein
MAETSAYWIPETDARFVPTAHVSGAWNPDEQHVAPAIGLLTHAIERDRDARRADDLRITRLAVDVLGVLRLEPVEIAVTVLRTGRTIELVEARLAQDGRTALIARAWLAAVFDTAAISGTAFPPVPARDALSAWDPGAVWPGGFVRSLEARRAQEGQGRGVTWLRPVVGVIDGREVSPTARIMAMIDVANGLMARVDPDVAIFPSLDFAAHLLREPEGEWVACDTTASFGPRGAGLTHSVLHDDRGPFGTLAQTLTVRPR